MKLWDNVRIFDEQARCAIESNRMAKKTVKQKTDEQEEPVVAE